MVKNKRVWVGTNISVRVKMYLQSNTNSCCAIFDIQFWCYCLVFYYFSPVILVSPFFILLFLTGNFSTTVPYSTILDRQFWYYNPLFHYFWLAILVLPSPILLFCPATLVLPSLIPLFLTSNFGTTIPYSTIFDLQFWCNIYDTVQFFSMTNANSYSRRYKIQRADAKNGADVNIIKYSESW